MDEWSDLEQALRELAESGAVEVREDGDWLAALGRFRCEVLCRGKQPLVHLWSAESSLTRRVLRISSREPDRIVLEVERFGRAKPGRLEFRRADSPRPAGRVDRERFRAAFARMLAGQFPDARVDSLTAAPDLKHSLSALYTRGVMTEGAESWAVMGVSARENSAAIEGMLGFGLLWLDHVRQRGERRPIRGLRLFLPEGEGGVTLHRRKAIGASASIEVFEFRERDWRAHPLDAAEAANRESWLVPRREVEAILSSADAIARRVRSLLPSEPSAIQTVVPPGTRDAALRFRGLEFARWSEGLVFHGLGDDRQLLHDADWAEMDNLVRRLDLKRSPFSSDTNDELFRAAPERWLESMILDDPLRLDAQLNAAFLYSQVPALRAGDRGVIDLLGVTRQGRLAVIELKASEDVQLPLQAVDYWLRVSAHHREGDFLRYGYFPGVELRPEPPLLWLVAPGLRFHPATDVILRYLSPEIQVTRIGLNETWRRGLQIVFRQ